MTHFRKELLNITYPKRCRGKSVTETSETLGVSRNFLMSQIRQGLLRARRFGRRVIILDEDFEAYLERAELFQAGTKDRN
jgi:excisionase family DNA binding protein